MKLLGEAEVTEPGKASKLDVRMKFLEESSPLGANHPAVKQYNKCMRGAGDTVRSIIIRKQKLTGNRRMNLSMSMNPKKKIMQGAPAVQMAVEVASL